MQNYGISDENSTFYTSPHKLIIAEKPSVARAIYPVLGANSKNNGYMEGNGYIVSWCFGHLVGLCMPNDYGEPWNGRWSFAQLPMLPEQWKFKIKSDCAEQFKILKKLMNNSNVDEVICATDADREGECIFRYVYRLAGCRKPVKRLWVSSLEESAIRDGMCKLKDGAAYDNLYAAGFSRAKADWLVGMNASRLFSVRYKSPLNLGRVQTPTLAMIVKRDYDVAHFVNAKVSGHHAILPTENITNPAYGLPFTPETLRTALDNFEKAAADRKQNISDLYSRRAIIKMHGGTTPLPKVQKDLPEITYASNPSGKISDNIDAIREVLRLEEAERTGKTLYDARANRYNSKQASDARLRKYCGWGGLPQLFDERFQQHEYSRKQLKEMLTPEEYAAARESTLNAHYTPQIIIDAMYKAVQNMELPRNARILEPACGTGNFISRMPHSLSDAEVTGVELDSITARIAKQLNRENPNVRIVLRTMQFYTIAYGNGALPVRKREQQKPFSWTNDAELDKLTALNQKINSGATMESLKRDFENAESTLAEKEKLLEKSKSDLKTFYELKEKLEILFEGKQSNVFTREQAEQALRQYQSINQNNYRNVEILINNEIENVRKAESELNAVHKQLKEASDILSTAEKVMGGTYVQSLVGEERERREANYLPNGIKHL